MGVNERGMVFWHILETVFFILEVFIEHIPHAERLQARMHAVQLYNRRDISAASNRAAIAYTGFVYGHIQGVGVTAYRIYNIHCEAGEVGPNVTNNRKKTAETIAMMSVKYIDREKTLFPSGHLKA